MTPRSMRGHSHSHGRSKYSGGNPPSGGGGGSHPNQPAGFTQVAIQPMDVLSNSDYGPTQPGGGTTLSIISDPTNPGSSVNVAQLLYPAGFGSGSAPGGMFPTANPYTPQPKELYFDMFIKISSNWKGEAAGINKILFLNFGLGSGGHIGSAVVEFAAMGGIDGTEQTLQPSVSPEGAISMNGQPGPSFTLAINTAPHGPGPNFTDQVTRGAWHRFEGHVVINTPGNEDGGLEWWWDTVQFGSYLNQIRWDGDGADLFQNVDWVPTWGGGGGDTVPSDQFMYLKDLYISGK